MSECPVKEIVFPEFSGLRCLMMPFVQGDPGSVPGAFAPYAAILREMVLRRGEVGYLTIDESVARAGTAHRGARATTNRALHTEAGRIPGKIYCWGGGGWGKKHRVTLDRDVQILLSNSLDGTCALWDAEHEETSADGDLGAVAELYPYESGQLMRAGEVRQIGILTPHESLPVREDVRRQFLRIIGSGVHGREPYFTRNEVFGQ